MTFEEWFEEAWRTGHAGLMPAEYKADAKMAALAGWDAARYEFQVARSVPPEVAQITEHQLGKIEAHLIGPGTGRFATITYCHVCGNNIDYGHMENCAWAKVKTIVSPQLRSQEKT